MGEGGKRFAGPRGPLASGSTNSDDAASKGNARPATKCHCACWLMLPISPLLPSTSAPSSDSRVARPQCGWRALQKQQWDCGKEGLVTSTVSRLSSPRSLVKCEVAVTLAASTFWKFLTTARILFSTSSLARKPEAKARLHCAAGAKAGRMVARRVAGEADITARDAATAVGRTKTFAARESIFYLGQGTRWGRTPNVLEGYAHL